MAKIKIIAQSGKLPYGTGAPLVTCENIIKKNEYFAFLFGDDLFKAKIPSVKQLIDVWQKEKSPVFVCC